MSDIVLVSRDQTLLIPQAYNNITVVYNERGNKGAQGSQGPVGALSGYETTTLWTADINAVDAILDTREAQRGAWAALTPINGWIQAPFHRTCRYRKIDNIVYLEGVLRRSSGTNNIVANLPVGFRPLTSQVLSTIGFDLSVGQYKPSRVDVEATGNMIYNLGGGDYWLYICINFPVN